MMYFLLEFFFQFYRLMLEIVITPAAMNTPSTQTMASKYHFPLKEPEALGEMAVYRSGAR